MRYKQQYVDTHAAHSDWWVGSYIYETPISTINLAPRLRENIFNYSCKTMLDYGSGKGNQYTIEQYDKYLDVQVDLYDPGVPGIDILPDKTYDAIICNHSIEYIPEDELPEALTYIFSKATKFVMIFTASVGSNKSTFIDGTPIEYNVQPEQYWLDKIAQYNVNNIPVDLYFAEV